MESILLKVNCSISKVSSDQWVERSNKRRIIFLQRSNNHPRCANNITTSNVFKKKLYKIEKIEKIENAVIYLTNLTDLRMARSAAKLRKKTNYPRTLSISLNCRWIELVGDYGIHRKTWGARWNLSTTEPRHRSMKMNEEGGIWETRTEVEDLTNASSGIVARHKPVSTFGATTCNGAAGEF